MLDREPLRAYSLASRLDDTSLLEQAAKNTLSPNKLSWTMYGGDQTSTEAKVRLVSPGQWRPFSLPCRSTDDQLVAHQERYHLAHIEAARACLTFPVLGKNCHCTYRYSDRRNYSDSDKGIWEECLLACYKNLKANSVPHEMMRDEVNGRGGRWADCPSCATRLSSKIAEVRRAWEESGRGKHYINLVSCCAKELGLRR